MFQVTSVAKISILYVLSKPVLSKLQISNVNWSTHLFKLLTEQHVLLLVFLAVVPGKIKGVTKLSLFIIEVISHQFLKFFHFVLVIRMMLNIQQ